jgi:hypothetical protein
MRTGRWSRALWVAALLPLFAASVLPTQLRTLVCRFTGAIMDVETCCPANPEAEPQTQTELSEQGCCEVRTVDLRRLVAEQRSEAAPPHEITAFAAAPTLARVLPSTAAAHAPPVGPPPLGPPLLLLKRSFLI